MFCSICGKRQTKGSKGRDFELRRCPCCRKMYCRDCGTCKECVRKDMLAEWRERYAA